MISARAWTLMGATALTAAALVVVPAAAAGASARDSISRDAAIAALAGRFTPAKGEPALLARYAAISNEARRSFSFTPALSRVPNREVTLVSRAIPMRSAASTMPAVAATARVTAPSSPAINIAPVSYRLGSAVGFTRFTAPDIDRTTNVDIATLPQVRRPVDPTQRPSRFGGDLDVTQPAATRSRPGRTLDAERPVEVDVTGSYRLTRNIDLTAGVRLRREDERLAPITDTRQDSQAVFVGTQFRF